MSSPISPAKIRRKVRAGHSNLNENEISDHDEPDTNRTGKEFSVIQQSES